ncbi:MAG: alpha-2-macroglobulin family protein, partial [Bacteroidota bacterium]
QSPGLVRHLSAIGRKAYSTQDRAWLFLALGKAASKNADADVQVEVVAKGRTLGTYKAEDLTLKDAALHGSEVVLKATGKGSVYFFWNTEGIKKSGDRAIREVDDNIRVRRNWYHRDGRPLVGSRLKQGELIVCEIELTTGLRSVENLVVSDLIPAGFEIENPRVATSTALNWLKTNLEPEYTDVRDDRLLLFTDMGSNSTRKYHYMMRVVNAGKFRLAPIGCEAMYDPDFKSYHGARDVYVEAK